MSTIRDEEQEYQYSQGFTTPSGHEFQLYETGDNERFVVKHSKGSHIEFKADGSVFIKSMKDLHMTSGLLSDASDSETTGKASQITTQRVNTDLTMEVLGEFNLKCKKFNLEVGETAMVYAGEDLEVKANNIMNRATENVSTEAQKSIYNDAAEITTRAVSQKTELGTHEDGGAGGIQEINLNGHAVINNMDANGGITIASKGYLNLVCGQERVDVVGKYDGVSDMPGQEAVSTYTTKVYKPSGGSQDVSSVPGDYHLETDAGATFKFENTSKGSSENPEDGLNVLVQKGDHKFTLEKGDQEIKIEQGKHDFMVKDKVTIEFEDEYEQTVKKDVKREVTEGKEELTIAEDYIVMASKIYLN